MKFRNLMLPETHIVHTHHKTKGQEMRVGRELKRKKGKHGDKGARAGESCGLVN